jgi:hypothetical protein
MAEKVFSLFNPRWVDQGPNCVQIVPQLFVGEMPNIEHILNDLKVCGSRAAPGFMDPEGIIIFHHAARQMFKVTLKNDATPKSAVQEYLAK